MFPFAFTPIVKFRKLLDVAWNTVTEAAPYLKYNPGTNKIEGSADAGPAGPQGEPGPQGPPGAPGTAATLAIGTVTTGAAGSDASVVNSGTSSAAIFDITIPRGAVGSESAMYVADYATLQEALTAFSASSTVRKLIFPANATYTVSATQNLASLVNKIVEGNGATIHMTGAGTKWNLRFSGTWSNSRVRNLNFTSDGSNTHFGVVWESQANNSSLEDCCFTGLSYGIFYQGTHRNRIRGCRAVSCLQSGIHLVGEYVVVDGCEVWNGTNIGIRVIGGNNVVMGSTIQFNAIGVQVDGGGANSDHGQIIGNTINHNTKAGVYLNGLVLNMDVIGNQIWQTTGSNLGTGVKASSFGIYVLNSKGANIRSNTFGNNKFSLGIEGISRSQIIGNDFIGLVSQTTNHIKELGGTNANYLIDSNIIDSQFVGAESNLQAAGATLGTNLSY